VFTAEDASCNNVTDVTVTAGAVTVTSADSTSVDGTFDITFKTGDQASGSFHAGLCNLEIITPGPCGS
jgi:hypothetical protein